MFDATCPECGKTFKQWSHTPWCSVGCQVDSVTGFDLEDALRLHFGNAWPPGLHVGFTVGGDIYFASWPTNHQRYLIEFDRIDRADYERGGFDFVVAFVAQWIGVQREI